MRNVKKCPKLIKRNLLNRELGRQQLDIIAKYKNLYDI